MTSLSRGHLHVRENSEISAKIMLTTLSWSVTGSRRRTASRWIDSVFIYLKLGLITRFYTRLLLMSHDLNSFRVSAPELGFVLISWYICLHSALPYHLAVPLSAACFHFSIGVVFLEGVRSYFLLKIQVSVLVMASR